MQGYAGDKYTSQVGEGHISIFPWHYSGITQGTWVWSADAGQAYYGWVYNTSHTDSDRIDYTVYLDIGTYTFTMLGSVGTNVPISDILIDSVSQGTIDWYGSHVHNVIKSITGIVITVAGLKTLSVKVNGKHASSSDYYLEISSLTLYRTA